jgi:hypothetical protein
MVPPRERTFPAAAMQALDRGRKLDAIRIVRQEFGVDLAAAKRRAAVVWAIGLFLAVTALTAALFLLRKA